MSEIQFILVLIFGLAILLALLFIGLFCRERPCRLLRRVWSWPVDLFNWD